MKSKYNFKERIFFYTSSDCYFEPLTEKRISNQDVYARKTMEFTKFLSALKIIIKIPEYGHFFKIEEIDRLFDVKNDNKKNSYINKETLVATICNTGSSLEFENNPKYQKITGGSSISVAREEIQYWWDTAKVPESQQNIIYI